jgi:hypothetical protein
MQAQHSIPPSGSSWLVTGRFYLYILPSVQGQTRYYKVINQRWRIIKLDAWHSLRGEHLRHAAKEMWTNDESFSDVEQTFWRSLKPPSWCRIEWGTNTSRCLTHAWKKKLFYFAPLFLVWIATDLTVLHLFTFPTSDSSPAIFLSTFLSAVIFYKTSPSP